VGLLGISSGYQVSLQLPCPCSLPLPSLRPMAHDPAPPPAPAPSSSPQADGSLLAAATAGMYLLFTLLPGSSTRMVTWPWVLLWQAALVLPMVWLLWQLGHKPPGRLRLGNGFDGLAALAVGWVGLAVGRAEFAPQARWYGWAALGSLATLYALCGWLTPRRTRWLLRGQGLGVIGFASLSLGLWLGRIYVPELARLQGLTAYGVEQRFGLGLTSLRNWYPLGHPNYVAGYLVLGLALLGGLALSDSRRWRWLWAGGGLLVGLDLYTTQSRGGLLGLVVLGGFGLGGLVLGRGGWRYRLGLALGALALGALGLTVLVMTNERLQGLGQLLRRGDLVGGQLSYRIVTYATGWAMGWQRPLTGLGPGSVVQLYQRHRPLWAGREAEFQYQLHGTPAQLWAELGLGGMVLPLAAAVLLGVALWRSSQNGPAPALPPPLRWSLVAGLAAYGLFSLTDYQLDLLAISGLLITYFAVLLADLRPVASPAVPRPSLQRGLAGVGLGIILAGGLWLVPIYRAWGMAAQGFAQLDRGDLPGFVQALGQAHRLTPWEPYYPYQLAWNLGDFSYQNSDAQAARAEAIQWFERGIQAAPYQEFGFSNLGWLLLPDTPPAAQAAFAQAAQLVSAKPGVFLGLGYALLLDDQPDLATDAFALEVVRHPLLLTSSLWRLGRFAPLYPALLDRLDGLLQDLQAADTPGAARPHLSRLQGTLAWWTDDLAAAEAAWDPYGTAISRAVLRTAQGERPDLASLPERPGKYALQAWFDPPRRRQWLARAWVTQPPDVPQLAPDLPPDQLDALVETMDASASFDQWLKQNAPIWQPRSQRVGFGLLMRHNHGPSPADFYPRLENLPMAQFFPELVPSPVFLPAFDRLLQPYWDRLTVPLLPRPEP